MQVRRDRASRTHGSPPLESAMSLSVRQLSDQVLLGNFANVIAKNRANTVELLLYMGEIESRRLYAAAGFSSMFAFCIAKYGFSEDMAYKRIRVARKARRFPSLLRELAQGRLHLYGAYLL